MMAAGNGLAGGAMGDSKEGPAFDARLTAVARRLSAKPALVGDGRTLDYATFESTTRAIAARLESAAAGRPGFVAMLFSRKTVGVQAMNAALRCGRAYVPLDGEDPDERLRFVLRDCEPVVLLVDGPFAARARALADGTCTVVAVNGDETPDPAFAMPSVDPCALASLFYTSGSTGAPKGVMQRHDAALFFADTFMRKLGLGENDRMSLLFSLNFGACVVDAHGAFLRGATLCTFDLRHDGIRELAGWLERERITVVHTITTVFRELVARLAPGGKLGHLRVLNTGGEATFASDAAKLFAHTNDGAIFVNHLASTEVHVIAQHAVARGDTAREEAILPAGAPPEGVEVRIRRDDGSEAGPGEVGAIVVSSRHVSPGYWRRPDLDAQHFPPDPWHPGQRCNVSGDRGYIDDAGLLHFLGREGTRVKIRGHTVDLAEIEAAMAATPGVVRSAAFAPAPGEGMEATRIVAFATLGEPIDAAELRRRLADRLPSYMLPSAFVFLDAFPTTSSGKVDRLALAKAMPEDAPAHRPSPAAAQGAAPDELELAVAGVFERLLKLSAVGPRDDFFLLGGDSLLAAELQGRLRDAFGTDVPHLHRHSTVADVAAAIRAHRASSAARAATTLLIPFRAEGTRPPMFLAHGRLGQALVSPRFLALLGGDQPVYGFRARGLDGDEPHGSIEAMAADYVAEIRRVRPHGPYLIGAQCIGAFVAIEIARILRAAGETLLPLLLLDPPERAFAMSESNTTDAAILRRIKAREADFGNAGVTVDPEVVKASGRFARAFERAIAKYVPRPWDGPVCMLVSTDRLAAAPRTQWRKIYAGETAQYVVADRHSEALDASTPRFAEALAKAMRRVYRDFAEAH